MFSNRAGSHIRCQDETFSKYDYYTFSPTPICEISIKFDDELCSLLSNAQRLLGLLEGSCRHISGIENINTLIMKKEASTSCIIDDTIKFSYLDLFIPLKHKADKIAPVLNCIKALEHGIGELNRMQLTNKVIFSAHEILMAHKRDLELIGDVRKKQIIIGDNIVSVSGMPTYNPPESGELIVGMLDIQKFIGRIDTMDILIKAALLHYQLEVVHPFESGNGKIGRILTLMYLFKTGILTNGFLPISEFFEAHKIEYFDRIKAVHNLGEYEQWIKFFLKALIVSANTSLKRIENILQLREENSEKIKANISSARDEKYLLEAYKYTEKNVAFNVSSLADGLGISYNTAAKIVQIFTDLGILKLDKKRSKFYLYNDFLKANEIII